MSGAAGRPRPRRLRRMIAWSGSGWRLGIALLVGVGGGVLTGVLALPRFVPTATWLSAAVPYLVLTWIAVGPMDHERTARRATKEDPAAPIADLVLLLASVASLGGVALLLVAGHGHDTFGAVLGACSVAVSWFLVHTLYTLGYARIYYAGTPGGIEFNQKEPPAYADFAYFAFTVGMTYQVSDTTITETRIRRLTLHHALLSYLLGAVVLAIAINLVANLT